VGGLEICCRARAVHRTLPLSPHYHPIAPSIPLDGQSHRRALQLPTLALQSRILTLLMGSWPMECRFMWHNDEYRGSAAEGCSPRGIARSIVRSILPPWAIGHEYGLWRKVATMGASSVTTQSWLRSGESVRFTALLDSLACEPLVTWAKATIRIVLKGVATMGRLPPHMGLQGAFETFRRCHPEHVSGRGNLMYEG